MHELESLLTVIVPVRGQSRLLKGFFRHGLPSGNFKVLVADGGTDHRVQRFVGSLNRHDVNYVKFAPDSNWSAYLNKVASAAQMVETPYATIVDADDYALKSGMLQALELLENDPSASCAGRFISAQQPWRWAKTGHIQSERFLNSPEFPSVSAAMKFFIREYGAIPLTYYNVHRIEALRKVTARVASTGIGRPFIDQYWSVCSLAEGPVISTLAPNYVHVSVVFERLGDKAPTPIDSFNRDRTSVEDWHRSIKSLSESVIGSWPIWAEVWAKRMLDKPPLIRDTRARGRSLMGLLLWANSRYRLRLRAESYSRLFSPRLYELFRSSRRDELPRVLSEFSGPRSARSTGQAVPGDSGDAC